MAKESSNGLIQTMEDFFKKAPSIPANGREALVKISPILALVFGVLGILVGIGGLGVLTVFSPLAVLGGTQGVSSYGSGFISTIFYLVSSVMLLMAYPGLKARNMRGWNMLFWSETVYLIGSLITLSIVNGIIGALIGYYLLFQIKSYYK